MAEPGIQSTLFDYFKDTEYFTLKEANELVLQHQNRDVNTESIRARIYEGVNKGLFERVGKGLYTVTRKDEKGRENTCMLINGDGRDLSKIPDNSIDSLITDHPYALTKSLKGGNRNFAEYDSFLYTEDDFKEKLRVLKPGCFLVEFLPEENGDNYEYLFKVKDMARKVGFEYYAKVPWKKGDFVANTGRKSKNTEDVVFFSKGKARDLRPDAKKNKAYESTHTMVEFKEYIPGSVTVSYSDMGGMGSSNQTEVNAIDVDIKISVLKEDKEKAESLLEEAWYNNVQYSCEDSPLDIDNGGTFKYEELYDMNVQEYILRYITAKGLSFDDISKDPVEFFMSGANGMLPTVLDVQPTNKKDKIHQAEKPVELLEKILQFITKENELVLDQFAGSGVLGEAAFNMHRDSILIEKDVDTYNRMFERISALGEVNVYSENQQKAINTIIDAIEAQYEGPDVYKQFVEHCDKSDMPVKEAVSKLFELPDKQPEEVFGALRYAKEAIHEEYTKVLECSSRGDKRFSPIYAKVAIHGKEKSIEEWYQSSKRSADGKKVGRNEDFEYFVDPYTNDKLSKTEAPYFYRGLWITYLKNNPDLVEFASQYDEFSNIYDGKKIENSHHWIIAAYVKGDRERYIEVVKASDWYKNMVNKKKPPLDSIIKNANNKTNSKSVSEDKTMPAVKSR